MQPISETPYTYAQYYEPLPSTFTLVERPIRWLHDKAVNEECSDNWMENGVKMTAVLLLSIAIQPIVVCSSPVTMVADLVVGAVEISFAYYKGCDTNTLKNIAHIKFIASPIQHLSFIFVNAAWAISAAIYINIGGIAFTTRLIVGGGFTALISYQMAQLSIRKLPAWAKPNGFNIFINGGAINTSGYKYTDNFDKEYNSYKKSYYKQKESYKAHENRNVDESENSWKDMCQNLICIVKLTEVKAEHGYRLTPYDQFKNGIVEKLEPRKLLGLENNFTVEDLRKVYKKFSAILHPDKNIGRENEATELIKCFAEAHIRLENELKQRLP